MSKIDKYLKEQTSKAVKQVENLLSSYYRDEDKMRKMYMKKFTTAVDAMTSVDEMNDITNQLDFNDSVAQELMSIMANRAQKLGVIDDFQGEF